MADLSYHVYSKCDRCREGKIEKPENLCYYHQKIEDGLIEEPKSEIPYVDVWVDNDEMLQVFMEQSSYWANSFANGEQAEDLMNYAGTFYRYIVGKWDEHASSWRTFCSVSIRNAMLKLLAKEVLHKQRQIPLGDMEDQLPDPLDIEELILDRERRELLTKALVEASVGMSNLEKRILWHRLASSDPVSQTVIAEAENVSQSAVSQAEDRVLNKIKEVVEYEI